MLHHQLRSVGKSRVALPLLLVLLTGLVEGHDMWLQSPAFLLPPGRNSVIRAGNGDIFRLSSNAVKPERVQSRIVLGPENREIEAGPLRVAKHWLEFDLPPQPPGTYRVGLATFPRLIRMASADFNAYLEHDGLPQVLQARRRAGLQHRNETEQYSKCVKMLLQVGREWSASALTPLGLLIEIVPLRNPYSLQAGDTLPVKVLFREIPLAGVVLRAGTAAAGTLQEVRSDARGEARVRLAQAGRWYVRGIHMLRVDKADHSYQSYWTSLTFEIRP